MNLCCCQNCIFISLCILVMDRNFVEVHSCMRKLCEVHDTQVAKFLHVKILRLMHSIIVLSDASCKKTSWTYAE